MAVDDEPELVVGHPTRATLPALARKRRRIIGGRWLKVEGGARLPAFSWMLLSEHVGQARWMKSAIDGVHNKLGVLCIVGSLWLVSQVEAVRLFAGGKPFRA